MLRSRPLAVPLVLSRVRSLASLASLAPECLGKLGLSDDRFGLFAREGAEGFRADGPVTCELEDDAIRSLVVGRLEDLDDVLAAERHVDVDELPAAVLDDRV